MSARMTNIVGRFDAVKLDPAREFALVRAGRALELDMPGLKIRAEGVDICVGSTSRQLLVIAGTPHFRDSALAKAVETEGPGALLPGLLRDPAQTLNKLGGRFALMWVDLNRVTLELASDRFNTHGFCWGREDNAFAFATRADAVPLDERELDPQALFDYLYFHVIPAPRTIFRQVSRLAPGARLRAMADSVVLAPWWQPRFEAKRGEPLAAQKDAFIQCIREAVKRESQQGQVAAFLSGGTDSSTVVGMLSQTLGHAPRCYSMGFDADGYDEMAYARIAAKAYGADHREYYVTAADLVGNIPTVAAHYDQPFGNSSALPAYCLAKLARDDGFDKLLAGDGGDELFGGNTRYAKQKVFGFYHQVPGLLRRGLIEPMVKPGWAGRVPVLKKAKSYVEQALIPLPDRGEQYNLLYRLGFSDVLSASLLSQTDPGAPMALQREIWNSVHADNALDRQLGFDWRFTLADNDLPKVTGTTALAGLDVAFPLLTEDLIDLSLTLAPELKLRGFKLRWFFKEALRNFLPEEILTKKKHGFGLPFGQWALNDAALRTLSRESVQGLVDRGILQAPFVDALFKEHLPAHPGYYGEMVWISMMLEQWLQAHAPKTRFGN